MAELKKVMAWRRVWSHLRRRRTLYIRASQPSTLEDFEIAAQAIWDGLPEPFRKALGNVTVCVADFADTETLRVLRIRDPHDLLGLYHGAGLPSKSV